MCVFQNIDINNHVSKVYDCLMQTDQGSGLMSQTTQTVAKHA